MITNRPSIFIYTYNPDADILKEICAGIEEEGVLFDVIEKPEMDTRDLAYEAANESVLGSGIGLSYGMAAMQMRNVNRDKPVFLLDRPDKEMSRKMGTNSARAIKRKAFQI